MSDAGDDQGVGALLPIDRELRLRCAGAQAYATFVERIGQWWPAGFTASNERLAAVVLEARAGGRLYERNRDGGEFDWGTVRQCEPERRLLLSWTLALEGDAVTEIEVELADAPAAADGVGGGGCRVRFSHRGWRVGQEPLRAKFDSDGGWNVVLAAYQRLADG
jgi:uncharacterized protein YndB with AHSA1/START domain